MYFPGMQRHPKLWAVGDQTRKLNRVCQTGHQHQAAQSKQICTCMFQFWLWCWCCNWLWVTAQLGTAKAAAAFSCAQQLLPGIQRKCAAIVQSLPQTGKGGLQPYLLPLPRPLDAGSAGSTQVHLCGHVLSVSVALFLECHSKQALSLGELNQKAASVGKVGMEFKQCHCLLTDKGDTEARTGLTTSFLRSSQPSNFKGCSFDLEGTRKDVFFLFSFPFLFQFHEHTLAQYLTRHSSKGVCYSELFLFLAGLLIILVLQKREGKGRKGMLSVWASH